jgi:hypothetical protein
MGLLREYFETHKEETKGRLSRILVVADSSVASEALVTMLEAHYTKDDAQEMYVGSQLPYINIVDTSISGRFQVGEQRFKRAEYSRVNFDDYVHARIGLTFKHGKILRTQFESPSEMSLDALLGYFATDSRGQVSLILWSKIISTYAKRGDYDVALYPDTATKIASKVLGITSQGRGFTLPWECGSLVKMPTGLLSPLSSLSIRCLFRKTNERFIRYRSRSISRYNQRKHDFIIAERHFINDQRNSEEHR